MPALTRKRVVHVRTGMVCDRCRHRDEEGFNDFSVDHICGYGSTLDGTSVTATLCDACLVKIILDNMPSAVFKDSSGSAVSHDKVREIMGPAPAPQTPD